MARGFIGQDTGRENLKAVNEKRPGETPAFSFVATRWLPCGSCENSLESARLWDLWQWKSVIFGKPSNSLKRSNTGILGVWMASFFGDFLCFLTTWLPGGYPAFIRGDCHLGAVGQPVRHGDQLADGLVCVDGLGYIIAGVTDDNFNHRFRHVVVGAQADKGVPGIMGRVGREMLQVDLADIRHAVPGVDLPAEVWHDQVRMAGKFAEIVEVAHQWQDAVRDGDYPVLPAVVFSPPIMYFSSRCTFSMRIWESSFFRVPVYVWIRMSL